MNNENLKLQNPNSLVFWLLVTSDLKGLLGPLRSHLIDSGTYLLSKFSNPLIY